MPSKPTDAPDDEPTEVVPGSAASEPSDDAAETSLWPERPRVEPTTSPAVDAADDAGGSDGPAADDDGTSRDDDAPTTPSADDVPTPEGATSSDATSDADADPIAGKGSGRGRRAADRTTEGAKVAADRVSQAASATAQALRDTDVGEIARNTTRLIENTRPFFLAAFAIAFSLLAAFEDHASVGVVFAIAAALCVLGAAFSPAVDQMLRGSDRNDR